MLKKFFNDRLGSSPKVATVNIVLVASALVWYFYSFSFLKGTIEQGAFSNSQVLTVWGANLLGIAITAILGTSLVNRVRRRIRFILYWIFMGGLLSLMPVVVNIAAFPTLLVFSTLIGGYFGLGVPACMGYFTASTEAGNRSRLAGIIFLAVFLGFFLLGIMGIESVVGNSLVLASTKFVGLIVLLMLKPEEKQITPNQRVSFTVVMRNKSFLLYFTPWCMFLVVNYMAAPIVSQLYPETLFRFSSLVEQVLSGFVAVACGFFADSVGRKRLTLTGFVLLGLGYGSLGLVENIIGWWFYTIVDGIAWGIFYTIFLLTVWGDIAQEKSSERYYAVGSLPFLFSNFMRLSIGSYAAANIPKFAIFSFASVFLFLAVLPLVYAPETLPEKITKERELKIYVEKAQEIVQKHY